MISLPQKHYIAAAIWCALLGAAYLVIDSRIKPKIADPGNRQEVVIPRSRDGHFYVVGMIGGQPVTFMVDTGASSVSIGRDAARQLGLAPGNPIAVTTAGGVSMAEEVTVPEIAIGGIVINHVRMVVLPNLSGQGLLGQNVLRHLEVNQAEDRMTLRARPR